MGYKNREDKNKYQREWCRRNKDKVNKITSKSRSKIREAIIEYKKTKSCVVCGEDHIGCLEFHHKDKSKKEHNVADMVKNRFSLKKVMQEINKCVVLCANCHRKLHWKELDLPLVEGVNYPLKDYKL